MQAESSAFYGLSQKIQKFWSFSFQNLAIHSLDISNFVEYIYGKLILQNCWQNQIPNNKLRYFPGSRQLIDQRQKENENTRLQFASIHTT